MKKPPAPKSIKRNAPSINQRVRIVIACEGKNTERKYIEDCKSIYNASLIDIYFIDDTGVPETLVNLAICKRNELLLEAKKNCHKRNVFRVWVVFDRDEHPKVDESIKKALENKIDVAFSNPCFELWPLLHIIDYGSQDGRHAVQSRLKEEMPGYDHDNGAYIDMELIKENFPTAFKRAKKLNNDRVTEDSGMGCPSTTVCDLVMKIAENGKNELAKSHVKQAKATAKNKHKQNEIINGI